jgi:hypothetical protein
VLPAPSVAKSKPSKEQAVCFNSCGQHLASFLLFFDPEDGGHMSLLNSGGFLPEYAALLVSRQFSTIVEAKLSLCLTKHYTIKTYGRGNV